jgi:ATP-dependent Lhr-like helicase
VFADRLQPGDRFLLDGRCLEYRRSERSALLVEEVVGRPVVPRWSGDAWPLSRELARRLYLLRLRAAETLRDGIGALAELLHREYGLGGAALTTLTMFFQRQECVSEIPDASTFLIEGVPGEGGVDYYCHTPLNRAGNDALARVAVLRLARGRGWVVPSLEADLGFALFMRGPVDLGPDDWRGLLAANDFDKDLAEGLVRSDTLRERFRRVALTGLMLLRNPLGGRRRVGGQDWAQRRLFDKVRADEPDFVLLRQALREVRGECCDADSARDFLEQLPLLTVRRRLLTQVSPFASGWTQSAAGPVETVETPAEAIQRLHAEIAGNVS